jgi:hypothetical protein
MNIEKEIVYKKIPVLKIMILIMLLISIIFQSIISWVNEEPGIRNFFKDLCITIVVQTIFSCTIYGIHKITGVLFKNHARNLLRYPIELCIVCISCFSLLYGVYLLQHGTLHTLQESLMNGAFRLHISINMVAVIFIYAWINILSFYQLVLEKSAHAEKLQQDFAQVRLYALKSQINPHFLFNSLSVLSSLVHVNPETSEKFIVQLARAYCYILEQKDAQRVTLKEEMNFLQAYFYLLKIRFENKIILNTEITIDTEAWWLPPLCLQMLMENAVKHNKMSATCPLEILLYSTTDCITVTNNINLREEEVVSTGIGLENIKNRMESMTDKKMIITEKENKFSITIPLVKKNTNESSNY